MKVFVDTFAMIAWLNPSDQAHSAVRDYLKDFEGTLVTTEWVLMEVADALAKARTRNAVVEFLKRVRSDENYEIVDCDEQSYQNGLRVFASHRDKDWSLTDCISFGVMKARNLRIALTGDKHFKQAGFDATFAS